MILVVGGTSESVRVAKVFVDAGHPVLVSQATEIDMDLPVSPLLRVRRGRLDRNGFQQLLYDNSIRAVVDASHPFAMQLRRDVLQAAMERGLPRLRLERSAPSLPAGVVLAEDHSDAAGKAFALGGVVLLTTGSRSLSGYVRLATDLGAEVWARLAPSEESRQAVTDSGMSPARVEWAKGPFSVKQTMDLLRRSRARVLVAKDSGDAGGISERLEAASSCGCASVVVKRPDLEPGSVCDPIEALGWLEALDFRAR
ncbi:MAG: cobalt-precorrin-6A reductase [Fibrobacterota bacterium]|jgi:precorrin-6A/cobalt-precorrin-6A reductase